MMVAKALGVDANKIVCKVKRIGEDLVEKKLDHVLFLLLLQLLPRK